MADISTVIKSHKKSKELKKEYFIHGNTLLLVQDKLPEAINIDNVKKRIEKTIPRRLFKELDWIYVGEFPELKVREVESVYFRGAIYITNRIESEEELFASIIHELAHSVELTYGDFIYGDDTVAVEFISKRKKLREVLKTNNVSIKDTAIFLRQEFSPEFDKFLYQDVGYDLLNQLCVGIFISPYGATSLREYFANGFEHYFLKDSQYLEKISPKLYKKILLLTSK